ncbi:helicase, type I site-specific restriction-modification system restriction subunit [Bernardetia litoralis DSM 6794]|uniref:Helicase, type I site-specific restriction-modification system restriction subunit n=1 Tax=Bernardetia litoralis (strain ATCC 23117 / DSM 6794 / NBRC 15988 / NCIMB 1366 / Fx l1 / Sio-4) TaxID=880071 RepID=I4AFD8_BERLS|nr:type I restriction endonuclease [Bernardetia litoralis]AFM02673.1 helicase, type I site-specific restriction-modification system restriction subunit [Bernardetia litoralis DSM 6794]
MYSKTNEIALEIAIEKYLVGISSEELKTNETHHTDNLYGGDHFYSGKSIDFNKRYAIDEHRFWHFLENTQEEELKKLQRSADWKLKIMERYDRTVKKYGLLRVLRKGLDVEDAHFTFFYQYPLVSSSQSVKDNFEKNEFSLTRQLHYNSDKPAESIDIVLFVNGLPISTIELKNPWTGQTAKVEGIRQYQKDRDTNQPLLNFGRCLVHFTLDTDEAYMTTKLVGEKTFFLPFNKGNNNGKGNPVNPNGHKTAYVWEEVYTRKSLANIIQHFVRFDGKSTDALSKRTLFFPRYHQMDVVRKIVQDTTQKGVGKTYLIQHSAGSGKSNSITWLAYQLIEVYPTESTNSIERPLFDSVIVVTDRRLLDKQLRQNIKEFSEVKNIVAPAFSSKELRESLEQGKKIIITTIQKFPFIIDGIADLSKSRFAVIIDEAHSSQGGSTAGKMNAAMGSSEENSNEDSETEDIQDKIVKAMQARKMKGNASYFAFTATPKNTTLEKFGELQTDGSFKPFHLYSMKQAIEEGFILDVIANYTTYQSYYEIQKSIEDNPLFDTKKAQKKLKAFVETDKRTINTKAEVIFEHFMSQVVNRKRLKGKAKGMVITQNIETTVRYYTALKRILEEKGNPFKIVVAFSGKKEVDGIEQTETLLNGFSESDTRENFDTDEYRLLVVANKYLTGFDQPKLCVMYVDKKLQGVLAVQALSRINRAASKYGKKTEDLFVLDFFNSIVDIKASFDPFYTSTTLSEATDINVLHELKSSLDEVGVYETSEIEEFVEKFFQGKDAQGLSPIIDTAAARFNEELELEDKEKADFKIKAKQFVKVYGQISSIIPYEMVAWEKLFWFLKFLIPKLIIKTKDDDIIDELLESVDLSTYGLERKTLSHSIVLDDEESELKPQNANPRGAHDSEDEHDLLDEIINTFNQRWFHGWNVTPEDQRVKFVTLSKHVQAHPDFETKVANNKDIQNREIAFQKILEEVMMQQRKKELDLYKLYTQDDSFRQAFFDTMKQMMGNSSSSL